MYWFTSDEHFGHAMIIKHCNRPFGSVAEMNDEIIKRHNEVVGEKDTVVHCGDFAWKSSFSHVQKIIEKLNGKFLPSHIFLKGSHDRWLKGTHCHEIWEKMIDSQYVVCCHYAMRTWPRSHYGSFQLHGHSHGKLEILKNQMDVGVDANDFYPVSFEQVKEYMRTKLDNFNLVKQ